MHSKRCPATTMDTRVPCSLHSWWHKNKTLQLVIFGLPSCQVSVDEDRPANLTSAGSVNITVIRDRGVFGDVRVRPLIWCLVCFLSCDGSLCFCWCVVCHSIMKCLPMIVKIDVHPCSCLTATCLHAERCQYLHSFHNTQVAWEVVPSGTAAQRPFVGLLLAGAAGSGVAMVDSRPGTSGLALQFTGTGSSRSKSLCCWCCWTISSWRHHV